MIRSAASAALLFQLLLLTLAVMAGNYARIALSPVQEAMRNALALTDNQIAILQGPAVALAIMVGSVPVGLLVDRYPRARLILIFVGLGLIGSLATAFASSFYWLFAARAVVGLAAIATLIAAFSLVGDLFAPAQRGRATAAIGLGELGSPAAFAMGGVMLASHAAQPDGWRLAMLWTTGPPLAAVTFLMLALREPPRSGVIIAHPPIRAALTELWRFRAMTVPLLTARAMVGVADGATMIWAAPMLARRFHLSPDRIGAIMGTGLLVANISSTVAGGLIADVCQRAGGPRRTVLAMSLLALLSVPASAFAIASGVQSTSILLVVFVTLGFTVNVAGGALAIIVVPNEVRGTYMSVSMVAGAIFGVALAPLAVSALSDVLGGPMKIGQALGVVCLIFSLVAAAVFAMSSRSFPRRAAA